MAYPAPPEPLATSRRCADLSFDVQFTLVHMSEVRLVGAFVTALASGCGGDSTGRVAVADRFGDAQTTDGSGGRRGARDAGSVSSRVDATTIMDTLKAREAGSRAEGAPDLCAPVAEAPSDADAGECLGYTFTADEPPRTCGAGIDLLSFVTFQG